MKKFIDEVLIPLHHTERFGPYPTTDSKSIAAHSFDVALLSYLFAVEIEDADEDLVLRRALVHDLEEAETGDIPRFVKHNNSELKSKLEAVEADIVSSQLELLEESGTLAEDWKNAKEDSLEGQIVKSADIICAILDYHTEAQLGNELLGGYADIDDGIEDAIEICQGIDPAEQLLEEILGAINN